MTGRIIKMNGTIIYEEDPNGNVIIDKRIEAALEDGDPNFIKDYDLPPEVEKKVIDVLNKENELGKGMPSNKAAIVANRIKAELRASKPKQVNVSKINNNYKVNENKSSIQETLTKGQKDIADLETSQNENYNNTNDDLSTIDSVNNTFNQSYSTDNTSMVNTPIKSGISDNVKKTDAEVKYATTLKKIAGDEKVHMSEPKPRPTIPIDKRVIINNAGLKPKPKAKLKRNPNTQQSFVKNTNTDKIKSKEMDLYIEPRDRANVSNDDVPVLDSDWVTDVFMLGKKDLDAVVKEAMFWTTAELKVTDTSLGGNISINNLPQFTRTADIRVLGKRTDREPVKIETITGNHGMGRYYSEKIDDNVVRCYMEFGVPEFNGVFSYLISAIDYKSAVVANSGRSPLAYNAGHLAGSVAFFAAFPVASLVIWLGSEIKDIVLGPGNFDFYYMKSTMPKYWSIVNSLVMMMSTELGMILPTFNTKSSNTLGTPLKINNEDLEYFRIFMPEAITKEGYIDIFAVVTRTQRAINKYLKKQYTDIKTDGKLSRLQDLLKEARESTIEKPDPYHEYWDIVKKAYNGPMYGKKDDKNKKQNGEPKIKKVAANPDGTYNKKDINFIQNTKKWLNNFLEATKANMYGGAEYAVFNVEYLGSSTMSVSNEVGDLELEGILKGIGGRARAIKFSGGGGLLGSLGNIISYATDVAVGALDGITLNMTGKLLTLLLGEGNLNLPLRWTDSSISLPTHTFKMKLVSPYGNPMSQLINIYIPLAAIMAGSLPLATGMSSYTSPFLCNLYVRGYQRINLGMITSLEISKGTTNLPFNKSWKPLGIDVTFTVTDFNKILALPVGQDLTSMMNIIYDDNNPLNRYIQSLCGRDLKTTTFLIPNLKLRLSRIVDSITVMSKPEYLGMKIGDILRPLGKIIPYHSEIGNYNTIY